MHLVDMILELADGTKFDLYEYSYSVQKPTALFKLFNTDYATIKEKFTDENCATILIKVQESTIAEFKNYYIHGGILIDDVERYYTVNMQEKGISDMYEIIKKQVEELTENLSQSQADVAYLSVMTDLDESEGDSNE